MSYYPDRCEYCSAEVHSISDPDVISRVRGYGRPYASTDYYCDPKCASLHALQRVEQLEREQLERENNA